MELVKNVLLIYIILSFALSCYNIIRMYVVNRRVNNRGLGKQRILQLKDEGRFRQFPLYSMTQMSENKKLDNVRVTFFPRIGGDDKRFAIVCPGGGYAHLCTKQEGYPVAARLNELGISAFVLEYRVGRDCSKNAPLEDLATCIRYIRDNASEFDVDGDDYSVIGFSAGGNLAGLFGTEEFGYAHYNLPAPKALILGYPWTNVNHWFSHPYWNIWTGLMGIWLTERGNFFMFGLHLTRENRNSLCVQNWVTQKYPPTFMFTGDLDILVPGSRHADVLAKTFDKCNINYMYKKYFRLQHGVGLAVNTQADGWLDEAAEFWHNV